MYVNLEVRPSASHSTIPKEAAAILDELQAFTGAPPALAEIAADLAPALAALAAARDAVATVRSDALASRDDILDKIATDLAAGRATATDVHTASAAIVTAANPDSPVTEICQAAEHKIDRQTVRYLAAVGDRWITDVLRPLVDARVATIVAEVGDEQAERLVSAADHRADWAKESDFTTRNSVITQAFTELDRLHDIADDWRDNRAIPAVRREAWTYRYGRITRERSSPCTWCSAL